MLHYPDVSIEDQRGELTFLNSHLDLVWNMVLILGPMIFPLIILLIQEDPGFSCRFTHPLYQYTSQHANRMKTPKNTSVLWWRWHRISIEISVFKASILPLGFYTSSCLWSYLMAYNSTWCTVFCNIDFHLQFNSPFFSFPGNWLNFKNNKVALSWNLRKNSTCFYPSQIFRDLR